MLLTETTTEATKSEGGPNTKNRSRAEGPSLRSILLVTAVEGLLRCPSDYWWCEDDVLAVVGGLAKRGVRILPPSVQLVACLIADARRSRAHSSPLAFDLSATRPLAF